MHIFYENEGETLLDLDAKDLAERTVLTALDVEGCPYEAEVSLLLTEGDAVKMLNSEFRGIDKTTDVLSFPALDYEAAGDFDFLERHPENFNPETGELVLGDIVINKERVISQAKAYGHSAKREYCFLIAHSMLHLCGYDHMEENERKIMEERQRKIMEKLKIPR